MCNTEETLEASNIFSQILPKSQDLLTEMVASFIFLQGFYTKSTYIAQR